MTSLQRIGLILVAACLTGCYRGIPWAGEARVHVHVVDDLGAPVPDATVGYSWRHPLTGGLVVVRNVTDANGDVSALVSGRPAVSIRKHGFYGSSVWAPADENEAFDAHFKTPWLGLVTVRETVVLYRELNPVPMFEGRFERPVPVNMVDGSPIGIDLAANDWVAPHGTGVHADMELRLTCASATPNQIDNTAILSFPHERTGIIRVVLPHPGYDPGRSDLRLPREAPEDGYKPQMVYRTKLVRDVGSAGSTTLGHRLFGYDLAELEARMIASPAPKTGHYVQRDDDGSDLLIMRLRPHQQPDGTWVAWHAMVRSNFAVWYNYKDPQQVVLYFPYTLNPHGNRSLEKGYPDLTTLPPWPPPMAPAVPAPVPVVPQGP